MKPDKQGVPRSPLFQESNIANHTTPQITNYPDSELAIQTPYLETKHRNQNLKHQDTKQKNISSLLLFSLFPFCCFYLYCLFLLYTFSSQPASLKTMGAHPFFLSFY
jgi:hypothetical protein